jgi:hypothetical protein
MDPSGPVGEFRRCNDETPWRVGKSLWCERIGWCLSATAPELPLAPDCGSTNPCSGLVLMRESSIPDMLAR